MTSNRCAAVTKTTLASASLGNVIGPEPAEPSKVSKTMRKPLWVLAAVLVAVGFTASGHATICSPTDSHIAFHASGPAGLAIEGVTPDLLVVEQDANLLLTVPLANLSTGIGLRDKHMKEKYLEVAKYPNAVLTVARIALKVPSSGEKVVTDAPGTLQLHGQLHPVTVHYEAKGDGGSIATSGSVHVNMTDYGIQVPNYLGVTVKPEVDVTASFRVADH
jgi:polyisoprenoid-binding protein YceI